MPQANLYYKTSLKCYATFINGTLHRELDMELEYTGWKNSCHQIKSEVINMYI